MGITDRYLRRILHEDLSFRPYKLMFVQELNATDYGNRKNLCQRILLQILPITTFFCNDEAHFHLSGTVNKQNFRYWATNNPRRLHERPLHVEVEAIPVEMCRKSYESFRDRLQQFINADGRHLGDIIFKK